MFSGAVFRVGRIGLLLCCVLVGPSCEREAASNAPMQPLAKAHAPVVDQPVQSRSTADDVPTTDIYLGRLHEVEGDWVLSEVRNVTKRDGYDNQPTFSADSKAFLYTSVRAGQSDIYSYDLEGQASRQLTRTPGNEYSPTPIAHGASFSVIRELEGVQQLWRYAMDGSDQGRLFVELDRIGYHLWLGAEWAAFFLVAAQEGGVHQLVHAKAPGDAPELILDGPGRCIAMIPGEEAMSFMRPEGQGRRAQLMRYELEGGATSPIVAPRAGSEDYAWTPDGALLMAEGAALHMWTKEAKWREVKLEGSANSSLPSKSISRIAVSPDGQWVAFVEVISEPKH